MKRTISQFVICIIFSSSIFSQTVNLFEFGKNIDIQDIIASNVKIKRESDQSIKIMKGVDEDGFMTLTAPDGHWELTDYNAISFNVTNLGPGQARISAWTGREKWVDGDVFVYPGESKILEIVFKRKPVAKDDHLASYFTGMNGLPGGFMWLWAPVDPSRIESLTIKISENTEGCVLLVSDIKSEGSYDPPSEEELSSSFFPFIDSFGQYKHDNWPGKVLHADDFKKATEKEKNDLEKFPGPADWNAFGGWLEGPQLGATGHFRVEKVDDQWWLIDPEGYLFWSHGITCVRFNNGTTRINGRSHYFETLPAPGSSSPQFYNISGTDTIINFTAANLYKKFGPEWISISTGLAHQRLKSWGMNTMANWSDPDIYLENNTPYTVAIYFNWPRLGGGSKKFPDVFDPAFRSGLRNRLLEEVGKTTDDPNCIGYFIDNELRWNNLSQTALSSKGQQPAKKALQEFLEEKYQTIERLNKAWGTELKSWNNMLAEAVSEIPESASKDLYEFDRIIADIYYRICYEELKAVAPEKLYLGSRLDFHYYPDEKEREWVIYAASRYCDVISFNRYRFSAADLVLPEDIDKPVIIGEFHFGALDRGLPHTGLRSVKDQEQRGEAYISYVESALQNPSIVGVHWFQYGDQAYTGRFDGENYQIGFLDICDNPYWETIRACRKIGYKLYKTRVENQHVVR